MVVPTTRPCSVDICFSGITHVVRSGPKDKEIVILDHVDGKFEHGKLHAIMGPSGAGKSSLLNVLAGLNFVANGTVQLNSRENFTVAEWSNVVTPIRSYILQDDFMIPELTVRETLLFAAGMNRPGTSEREQQKLVKQLLEQFCLKEQGDIRISALSGGQRKRVSVAQELVNYKPLLFLDEPTTGLDSTSCYRLVEFLKTLAGAGCNVIATVHQPSSRVFAMFDTLTVLAKGGRLAYSGTPRALTNTIDRIAGRAVSPHENPADALFEGEVIVKLAKAEPIFRQKVMESSNELYDSMMTYQQWRANFLANLEGDSPMRSSSGFPALRTPPQRIVLQTSDEIIALCEMTTPTMNERLGLLFKRALVQTKRDIVFLAGRFIAMAFGTVIMSLMFPFVGADSAKVFCNNGFIFFSSSMLQLGTCVVTIMNSPVHSKILLRESINSWYTLTIFFWARTFIEMIIALITAVVFSIVLWMVSGQQQDPKLALPYVIVIMCIHTVASHHCAYILALFAEEKSLPQLPFAITMLHTVFGGYFIPLRDLPKWSLVFRYINWGAFAQNGLMKLAYAPMSPDYEEVKVPCKTDAKLDPMCQQFNTGSKVLDFWGIDFRSEPLWMDILYLAMYLPGFLALHWALTAVYLSRARRAVARL